MRTTITLALSIGFCCALPYAAPAAEVGTAFTYQGLLEKPAGTLVDDTCNFTFRLFDAAAGGIEIGASPVGPVAINVVDGIFVASPDFGIDAINGKARWLEITVQCPGDVSAVTLTPRVELKPVPYALALPGLRTQQVGTDEPNVIGGAQSNFVYSGFVGATIAGGGGFNSVGANYGTVGGGVANNASGMYATISGGGGSIAGGDFSTVGGGDENTVAMSYTTIGGGHMNYCVAHGGTIGGGLSNNVSINADSSAIGGGDNNFAYGMWSTIPGGKGNLAGDASTDVGSSIGGGEGNTTNGSYSTIGGGYFNDTGLSHSTVAGGDTNLAGGLASFVGGGVQNVAVGTSATIAGGSLNIATGLAATIGGGDSNAVGDQYGTIGGGTGNSVTSQYGTIGGGLNNSNASNRATIGGGDGNQIDLGSWAVIAGGRSNSITVNGGHSVIGGGGENAISGAVATICGGFQNSASAGDTTIGGGQNNTASGSGATIPGGVSNIASGLLSFAAGGYAQANHQGSFVWNSSGIPFGSTASGQFLINSAGNVGISTNSPISKLEIAAQDGLAITGFQPFMTLRDTNAANARTRIANANGGFNFFPESFIGGSAPLILTNTTGRVGIGDTTPEVALDVVGDINYTGVIVDVSDERLKSDIQPIECALEKIASLRGISFIMKGTSDRREVGLIAQDVQQVLPEAVRIVDNENGYLGVSYPSVVSLLVEAIKEIQSENDSEFRSLIEINAALARSNAELEARLARIEQLLLETSDNGGK